MGKQNPQEKCKQTEQTPNAVQTPADTYNISTSGSIQ